MDKHLHIITFDIPWPADYGGVIDLFYKILWLHKLGVKIHLHCFSGGRPPQDELDEYCEEVCYYPRMKLPHAFSLSLPYIISSRISGELLQNLQKDDHPVLMDGTHCTYLLYKDLLKNRKIFVRLHNVEFSYYGKLAGHEHNFFKKCYFRMESFMLKRYERAIANKAVLWPLSMSDMEVYKNLFGAGRIHFLPAFVPWKQVAMQEGKGCFCLYHGNLTVNENEEAAKWLLKEVFNDISIPLVIAGKDPSEELIELAHVNKNTCLVANPSDEELQDLIRKAQVNVLPSFNNTGVKLKLLNALFNGRFCLVNSAATDGASLYGLCETAITAPDFKRAAVSLYEKNFDENISCNRQKVLSDIYNNEKNARQIIEWIY